MEKSKNRIKIIFFGSDSFSVPILGALLDNFEVKLVVTKSDQTAGRGKKMMANPLKKFAENRKLNLLVVDKLDNETLANYCSSEARTNKPLGSHPAHRQDSNNNIYADIYVVAAFGLMIPDSLLESPTGVATINLHPSLLPKYRGPSPIESAILNGEKKTGVSIMVLDQKIDHGPIIAQEKEEIDNQDDFITLSERLEKQGAELLIKIIPDFVAGKIKPRRQNDTQATYCKLIKKENGKLDFTQDAGQILSHIRAFIHWPGSFATWKEKNKKVKIINAYHQNQLPEPPFSAGLVYKTNNGKPSVVCGNGAIVIETLQLEGKKPTGSISFLNGYPDFIGANLG